MYSTNFLVNLLVFQMIPDQLFSKSLTPGALGFGFGFHYPQAGKLNSFVQHIVVCSLVQDVDDDDDDHYSSYGSDDD